MIFERLTKRIALIALALLLMGAGSCKLGAPPPQWPLEIMIKVGETIDLYELNAALTFNTVEEDSRCPADATCVWEGNAKVALTLSVGSSTRGVMLNSSLDPQAAHINGIEFTFVDLKPLPMSKASIDTNDYQLVLKITKN